MKRLPVLAVLALLLPACGVFADVRGPGTPECSPGDALSSATIIQAQAVPTAAFGPCINELKIGWEYSAQEAESGRATFWLDSDRMGSRFLGISLFESCDPGSALRMESPLEGVSRLVNIRERPGSFTISIVPESERVNPYAELVLAALGEEDVDGRPITATIAEVKSEVGPSAPISEALERGEPVIIIGDRHFAKFQEGDGVVVEMRRPAEEAELMIELGNAIEEIEEDVADPRYEATWYHLFEGGCIVYEFDARGFGSETLETDVDQALGLYPLDALRAAARNAGYDI